VLEIKKSILNDAIELSKNLRKEDIEEVSLIGLTPLNSLLRGYIFSEECYSAFVDGKLSGMFGVTNINQPEGWASIWFLGSDDMFKVKRNWLIDGKKYINHFLEKYKILTNCVDIRNKKHIYWLMRMGAVFTEIFPVEKGKLAQFIIYRR
jgi:hypothetical protein